MNTNLPPLYIVAYDGEDIPGIIHSISKSVYQEGFTVVDVSMASGADTYKIFITCHRRTDPREEIAELQERQRGIADDAWLQTRIQQTLDAHYKDYYNHILDERAPNLKQLVSVRRHLKTEMQWTLDLDLQCHDTVGILTAITGVLSLYVNINDMLVRAAVSEQHMAAEPAQFMWNFYLQASLLTREVYDPKDVRAEDFFKEREASVQRAMPSIFTQSIRDLHERLKQEPSTTRRDAALKQRLLRKIDRHLREETHTTLWTAFMRDDRQRREKFKIAQDLVVELRNSEDIDMNRVNESASEIAHKLYDLLDWLQFAYPNEFHVSRLDVGYLSPYAQSGSGIIWNPGGKKSAVPYSVKRKVR